jgi:ABC-type glycerol-3-phosphate transport system permease component
VRQFFLNLPQELLDSARIDGATDWQVFWNIVLPLSKAVLAVIALFYAVGIWNSFFNAVLYITDASMWPVQLVLRQYVLQGGSLAQAADQCRTTASAATDDPDDDRGRRDLANSHRLSLPADVFHQGRTDRRHQGIRRRE